MNKQSVLSNPKLLAALTQMDGEQLSYNQQKERLERLNKPKVTKPSKHIPF